MRQLRSLRRIHEAQHLRQVAEVPDHAPRTRNPSAQERKNIEREIAPVFQRLVSRPAE
jgi:hypothetical protein